MITDRRLLQALAVPVRRGEFRRSVEPPPELTVGALMAPEIFTTAPDTLIEEAAAQMAFHRVGSLVVMEDGKPIGIITETDMFRVFFRLLGGTEHGLRVSLRAPASVAFRRTSSPISRRRRQSDQPGQPDRRPGHPDGVQGCRHDKAGYRGCTGRAPGRRSGYTRNLEHEKEVKPMIGTRVPVLDKGWIELQDLMGDDNAIVAAVDVVPRRKQRAGEGQETAVLPVAAHHTTPFEMVEFKFRVRAPVVVFWQWVRHRTWNLNSHSGRYTPFEESDFYEVAGDASSASPRQQAGQRGLLGGRSVADRSTCQALRRRVSTVSRPPWMPASHESRRACSWRGLVFTTLGLRRWMPIT